MPQKQLIGPFRQLIPLTELPQKGALSDDAMEVNEEAGILIDGDVIQETGAFADLSRRPDVEVHELEADFVGLPGLVDAHTHICFAGSRARDYAMRVGGKTYLEIAKAGGGIWDTVLKTRAASQTELTQAVIARADRHASEGITSCEVKSGYGLTVEEELKMLRAIQAAQAESDIDLVPSCLAAHMKARDFGGSRGEYLDLMLKELLPVIRSENLSGRIDIFIEESAFGTEESKTYLRAAKQMGFDLTIHADQFHTGGSQVAVEMGALSADHLEASGEKEIAMLAGSDVIAMALPGASLGLGCPFTPGRQILDAGGALAIATDWNPGSAPMGDLLMQAGVYGAIQKLSLAETWAALTFRAAAALNLFDRGRLATGMKADMILFPTNDHREILYHQGKMKPAQVWKNGKRIH